MKRIIPLLLIAVLVLFGMTGAALAENKFYFDRSVTTLFEGDELQLVLVREGDCAQDGQLTFKSSYKKTATVDENGVVQGLNKGTVTISATLKGEKRSWTASIELTVARRVESVEVDTKGLKIYEPWDPVVAGVLDPHSPYADLPVLLVRKGKTQTVSATCQPSTANNRRWKLTTSDDSVVRASGTGLTGRSTGEALVTVESVQNPEVAVRYRCLVVDGATRVRVTSDEKYLYIGDSIVLDAVVTPDTATIKAVTWSSDRPDNASVDEYGVVTGVSKGNAVITAKAADGSGYYGTFTVTVRQQPEQITLSKEEIRIRKGNYVNVSATVLPSTVNDKSVTWSSSDEYVAKVSSSGRITAVNPGVAIITCQSKTHPEVFAQLFLTVYQPVTSIACTEKSPYVAVGETIYLNWDVGPENATDPSLTFSTNKENVVRVGQDGSVTGLKRGECYVYATANDGSGKKGTVKVQVVQPVEGVSVRYDSVDLGVGEKKTNTALFTPEDASITKMKWTAEDATIVSVSGTGSKVTVTGRSWGETTVVGVTEDGSYVTTFSVQVGDPYKPLNIVKLYVEDEDTIRIQAYNASNLTINRFYYVIETYDAWGDPIVCNDDGRSNSFEGYYGYTLEPGSATKHGRFTFGSEFSRPDNIAMIVMRITGYRTADGETVYIPRSEQVRREWKVRVLDAE